MRHLLLAGASLAALGFSFPASAGNILLTGHDNDFHCDGSTGFGPCIALAAEGKYVTNGSSLPILVIDNGNELNSSLTAQGFSTVKESVSAVTAGMFNHSLYSAFAVASVTSCGGCDNPPGTGTVLSAFSAAIASFVDAGGGILGMTSAGDPAGFDYVPDSAGATVAIFHSSGFVATAAGTAGIPGFVAVNGDETHNIFSEPGTGGVSPLYSVAEVDSVSGDAPVTLFLTGAAITCTGTSCHIGGGGTPTPEPASLALLGAGLFGLGAVRRRLSK